MNDFVSRLAASSGLDVSSAEQGLTALLAYLKRQLGDDTLGHILSKIPQLQGMAPAEGQTGEPAGGLLGAVESLAGKLVGEKGVGAVDLLARLRQAGIGTGTAASFLTHALTMLKEHLPADLIEKIMAALPALPGVSHMVDASDAPAAPAT